MVINVHFPSSAADFVSGLPVGRPADRLAGWLAGLLSRRRANDIVPCSTNMAPELRERSKAEAEAERLKRKQAHLDANVH